MNVLEWLVVLYAFWAMILDLARSKIGNQYLIFGWLVGAVMAFIRAGAGGLPDYLGGAILPIILLFILFYFRMMGAGDIKLLSVLGGMVGIRASVSLLICSFLAGAILSIGILTYRKSWSRRFRFLIRYVHNYMVTGLCVPYRPEKINRDSLHFALPVFAAVLMWKGGWF